MNKTLALFDPVKTEAARRFQAYLQTPRSRIPNNRYYQMEGLPISSSPVESWIKQVDKRIQITVARWIPFRFPQILALRCAYLNSDLDFSLIE